MLDVLATIYAAEYDCYCRDRDLYAIWDPLSLDPRRDRPTTAKRITFLAPLCLRFISFVYGRASRLRNFGL